MRRYRAQKTYDVQNKVIEYNIKFSNILNLKEKEKINGDKILRNQWELYKFYDHIVLDIHIPKMENAIFERIKKFMNVKITQIHKT